MLQSFKINTCNSLTMTSAGTEIINTCFKFWVQHIVHTLLCFVPQLTFKNAIDQLNTD